MWRRIEVNARVDHPVERVFAYLANPLLWHEFAPACVFRRQIGDLPPDVGTRWMATDQIGPFRFHFVDELAGSSRTGASSGCHRRRGTPGSSTCAPLMATGR